MAEENAEADAAAQFAVAHGDLLADGSIQFTLAEYQTPQAPAWLRWLGELLVDVFPLLKILFWIGVAAAALLILYVLARRLSGAAWPWPRRPAEEQETAEWRLEEAPARALLREADALAEAGRFSEAAHLILFRSIEEIGKRRPKLVRPALTSREIAAAPNIPPGPRNAFGGIVDIVERSLFGGLRLVEGDWRRCRSAYEEFAFAESWR